MGIQGLLQFTKNVSRESHLKELSGTTVAIDAYCWLHKGCYSCAEKLVKGEKTNGNRQKYKKLAKQHLREGNLKAARDCFNRCVDVTSAMALEVIKACRKLGIDCIVAPYEADAQLAYLNKQGFAQTIITEDSDLIIFGCEKIFYKMDATGRGVLIEKNNLHQCSNIKPNTYTFEKFRRMCILSGCDYLPSLPGIGLAKACKFFMMTSITDIETLLRKLPTYLKMPNVVVDDAYIDGFIQAENTFQYQLAFCPRQRKLVPNDPYPDGIAKDTFGYAGSYFKDSDAFQIALGNIDVNTMKILDNFNPDSSKQNVKSNNWKQKKSSSIWHKDYVAKAVDDHEKDELHHGKTKDKVVTLSLDMLKKTRNKSPTKCHKSPRKCKTTTGGLDENELTALYSPSVKRRKNDFELSDVEISKSPSSIKRINPFRVVKKSPQKKILSR
ncbi:Exonuclease 1 [Nymphon striatum]|nr:Exonuclease 1 [Nymphon striatum]